MDAGTFPQAMLASLQDESVCKHLFRAYYAPSVELGAGETGRNKSHTRVQSTCPRHTFGSRWSESLEGSPGEAPKAPYSPHRPEALSFPPHRPQPLASFSSLQSIHSPQPSSGLLFLLSWYASGCCCLLTLPAPGAAWTTLCNIRLIVPCPWQGSSRGHKVG